MSKQPAPSGEIGPTWSDVRRAMEDLVATWDGCVGIETTLAPRNPQKTSWGLWVRVWWRERPQELITPERAAGRFWPCTDHRTMPGLIFRLCNELDHKLSDLAHDRVMGLTWTGSQAQAEHLSRLDPSTPGEGG